jgi:hypothetical protein
MLRKQGPDFSFTDETSVASIKPLALTSSRKLAAVTQRDHEHIAIRARVE